jgi:hypothetical protein
MPMTSQNDPENRSPGYRSSLVLRLERAADSINPLLAVFAIGLLFLNITLYVGLAASHDSFIWTAPHKIADHSPSTPLPQ